MTDRRTTEGYKLRVYIDQIKTVKTMSDEQWITQWICQSGNDRYITRTMWLSYLSACALDEADKMIKQESYEDLKEAA